MRDHFFSVEYLKDMQELKKETSKERAQGEVTNWPLCSIETTTFRLGRILTKFFKMQFLNSG